MSFWGSVLTGVGASLIASIVFLGFLTTLRPKLKIAPTLAVEASPSDFTRKIYRVKIVNLSRRAAVDMTVEIFRETRAKASGGDNRVLKLLDSVSRSCMLPGRPIILKNDKYAPYARRIIIKDDLNILWENDEVQSLLVRVFARDSLTNFGRQFECRYDFKSETLVPGRFAHGYRLNVVAI